MKTLKRKYAITAGLSLLIMAVAAAFSYGFVYGNLVIKEDALTTMQNVFNSSTLFLSGIAGWLIIFITDIIVALALYHFFKDENNQVSILTALIRILYTLFLGIAISQLIQISSNIGNSTELSDSLATNINLNLGKFERIWSIGLIIFGIHLMGLGYLAIRNFSVPNIWGWMLLFAGISYFSIHITKNVMPDYVTQIETVEMILGIPLAIVEIGFAFWLLIRGGKAITIKVK